MELQHYLMEPEPEPPLRESALNVERRASITPSTKSDKRRSLPMSIMSELSATGSAGVSDFELRRRKAAKLTAFFGVDYRYGLIQQLSRTFNIYIAIQALDTRCLG